MGLTTKEMDNWCCPKIASILNPIHCLIKPKPHPCNRDHTPHYYSADQLNLYIWSLIPSNMTMPPNLFKRRKNNPYKICNNLHKHIIRKLGPIDIANINNEEEALAKKSRYNLQSLDLDQIKFIVGDNQCIVIEEEEEVTTVPPTPKWTPTPTLSNCQSKPRKGSTATFPNLIARLKKRHKKQFKKLTMRG